MRLKKNDKRQQHPVFISLGLFFCLSLKIKLTSETSFLESKLSITSQPHVLTANLSLFLHLSLS